MDKKELMRLQDQYKGDPLGSLKISLIEQMYANKSDDAMLAKLQAALYVLQDDYQSAVQCMLERDDTPSPEWLTNFTR